VIERLAMALDDVATRCPVCDVVGVDCRCRQRLSAARAFRLTGPNAVTRPHSQRSRNAPISIVAASALLFALGFVVGSLRSSTDQVTAHGIASPASEPSRAPTATRDLRAQRGAAGPVAAPIAERTRAARSLLRFARTSQRRADSTTALWAYATVTTLAPTAVFAAEASYEHMLLLDARQDPGASVVARRILEDYSTSIFANSRTRALAKRETR
jgi:hypothetical protein